jgi:hypothetical protein
VIVIVFFIDGSEDRVLNFKLNTPACTANNALERAGLLETSGPNRKKKQERIDGLLACSHFEFPAKLF